MVPVALGLPLPVPVLAVPVLAVPLAAVPLAQAEQRRPGMGRLGQAPRFELGAQPVHVGKDLAA